MIRVALQACATGTMGGAGCAAQRVMHAGMRQWDSRLCCVQGA